MCISIDRGTTLNVIDLCQIITNLSSSLKNRTVNNCFGRNSHVLLQIILVDTLIQDKKEPPRARILCNNIERGTPLCAIDLLQIMTHPVFVFDIYSSQELAKKEFFKLFEK